VKSILQVAENIEKYEKRKKNLLSQDQKKERKRRNIFTSQDLQIKSQGIFKKEFI